MRTFAQPQTVHDAADVVWIITNAETGEDCLGKPHGGPAVAIEARHARSGTIKLGYTGNLLGVQTAGPTRCAAFTERLHPFSAERTVPAGCRGSAYTEFT